MLTKIINKTLSFGLLGLVVSCSPAKTVPTAQSGFSPDRLVEQSGAAAENTLVLGDISSNPSKKIAQFQPLEAYLESRLKTVGIEEVKTKIAPDLEAMQSLIAAGEIDLYFDSPYPAMIVSTETGAQPVLRRWKKGVAEYSSIIFATKDSEIRTLEELKGKRIALESDYSTSGYMLPLVTFQEAGIELIEQSSSEASALENSVNYIFSGDEDNTVELVISGKVDAGALDNGTFAALPKEVQSLMTVVSETESVARHIALIGTHVSLEQADEVKQLLLDMDESIEGREALAAFENTTKFDEFPVAQSIQRLNELYLKTVN